MTQTAAIRAEHARREWLAEMLMSFALAAGLVGQLAVSALVLNR